MDKWPQSMTNEIQMIIILEFIVHERKQFVLIHYPFMASDFISIKLIECVPIMHAISSFIRE